MTANQVAYAQYVEARRSNQAKERENYRHNKATEDQAAAELTETSRHNVAMESYNWANLAEAQRHNMAGELEVATHNRATEAATNESLRLEGLKNTEQQRHNLAQESLTNWYNIENMRIQEKNVDLDHAYNMGVLGTKQREAAVKERDVQVKENKQATEIAKNVADTVRTAANVRNDWLNSISKFVGEIIPF